MKFQKGLLEDLEKVSTDAVQPALDDHETVSEPDRQKVAAPISVAGEHLFETLDVEVSSTRKYTRVFGVVVLFVVAAGIAIGYLLQPGIGDRVRDPGGYEAAVREHFLTKEKRTATDIIFYKCDGFYGAKVGVETRNDLQNPVFKLDTYSARVSQSGDQFSISAFPVGDGQAFVPCK